MLKRERKENRKKQHFANRKKAKKTVDAKAEARAEEVEKRRSRRIGEKGEVEVAPVVKKTV